MSTVTVSSIESFVAAVEAAEQRLAAGEAQARRAKALLLQAEKARDEAAARKAEAEQQLAPIEEALRKARALRALVGEEVISQGEALLEQTWEEAQAQVSRLQADADAAQAEVERLMAAPEVRAYLDYREAQEQAEREARAEEREELQARLAALRPGAAVGQGSEALADLATEAERAGFSDLAAQAREAAEAAKQVAEAQAQAEQALRRRQLTRWAERRVGEARPGDFVFILEEAENGPGAAIHLRPLPAHSGRLRFQVVAALGVENPPGEYSDVPSRGRAWRWRNPPVGEVEGLNEGQAGMVAGIVKGRLRSGWSINRANARLARQAANERQRETSRGAQVAGETEATEETHAAAPAAQPVEQNPAEAGRAGTGMPSPGVPVAGDLESLPPQVAARPRQAGLCMRQAVEHAIAAGEDVVLGLPGIGPASRAAVRERSHAPTWADCAAAGVQEREQAVLVSGEEPSGAEQDERAATVGTAGQGAPVIAGLPTPGAVSDAPLLASAVCEGAQPAYQSQPQAPEPTISVEGDGVGGLRLAQWRGAARVGLTPVARGLGLEEVQLLVHEDGEASTLVACWPGGETTLSCPVDGRVGQMRAVRELIQRIRAGA